MGRRYYIIGEQMKQFRKLGKVIQPIADNETSKERAAEENSD